MAMAEDLLAFFSVDEFAVPATLAGAAVVGIFDNGYAEAFGAIAMRGPIFRLRTADAASATVGAALVVNGTDSYRVTSVQPDGTGITVLVLEAD